MHEVNSREYPLGLGNSLGGTGEGQGDPGRQRAVRGDYRVVILIPETHGHASFVLILPAACHDRVDVHGVDLTGGARPCRGIRGRPVFQVDEHHRVRAVCVRAVDNPRGALCQSRVDPEIAYAYRIPWKQREVLRVLGHWFRWFSHQRL